MEGTQPGSDGGGDGGTGQPSLTRSLLILVLFPSLLSVFGGCLQYRENKAKHDEILGQIERLRQDVRDQRTRP